jgi:hypothetical protein
MKRAYQGSNNNSFVARMTKDQVDVQVIEWRLYWYVTIIIMDSKTIAQPTSLKLGVEV